jgi:hypothetical protein
MSNETTKRAVETQRDDLLAFAKNFEFIGPDDDGLTWLVIYGRGTTCSAMFNLGKANGIAMKAAHALEQERRSVIDAATGETP